MNEAHTETIIANRRALEAVLIQVIRIHEQLWMLYDITKLCATPRSKYKGDLQQVMINEEIRRMKDTYKRKVLELDKSLRAELQDYLKEAIKLGLPLFAIAQFGGYNVQIWEMKWMVTKMKEAKP